MWVGGTGGERRKTQVGERLVDAGRRGLEARMADARRCRLGRQLVGEEDVLGKKMQVGAATDGEREPIAAAGEEKEPMPLPDGEREPIAAAGEEKELMSLSDGEREPIVAGHQWRRPLNGVRMNKKKWGKGGRGAKKMGRGLKKKEKGFHYKSFGLKKWGSTANRNGAEIWESSC